MLLLAVLFSTANAFPPSDSATVFLKPNDPTVPLMKWIAFDDARRPVARGTTPSTLKQASEGVAITYCSDSGTGWLEVVVEVGRGDKGRMYASGQCTRVIVRDKAIQLLGVVDPRLAPSSFDDRS